MDARARRFRLVFFFVSWLGALPSLVSGWVLLGHHRVGTLCAAERPSMRLDELRTMVRWARLHEWGHVGALVAGLLVLSYSVAWAFERGRHRVLVTVLAAGLLLPALAVASWSGRVLPWRAFEPPVAVGGAALVVRAPGEWGGREYCLQHVDELRRLRLVYWLHVGGGALAVLLTLALTGPAAGWRAAKDS